MSELSDLLDRMRVRASVARGAITGELHDHDQVDVSFAPGFYDRTTDTALEQHLVSLARLMRAEYVRQYYAAVSTAFGRTITKDPPPIGRQDTDYAAQRQDLAAEGRSSSGRITITVRGMQTWRMRIAPGTVRVLNETQFAAQFREAASAVIRNQFAGIRALKNRIYD
jgi:hypothetical protein